MNTFLRIRYRPGTYAAAYGEHAPFSMRNQAIVKSFTKEFHKPGFVVVLESLVYPHISDFFFVLGKIGPGYADRTYSHLHI